MKDLTDDRPVDSLGRVVIPKSIRTYLNICDMDMVEVTCENDAVIMRKKIPSCVFCGSTTNLKEFHGKPLCMDCITTIRAAGHNH